MPQTVRSTQRADVALAALRVAVGAIFLAHGWQKVFGFGHAGVTGMLTGMHVPMPGMAATGLMALEFLGGIAVIFGLLTRFVSALFVVDMLCAILLAKATAGFFSPKGWELELLLAVASFALVVGGAGAASIDGAFARRRF